MNKKITSLLLCFVAVFTILVTAEPVLAADGTCIKTKHTQVILSLATDTPPTCTDAHSFDEENWGYFGADGHAHKCKNCDEHDTPQSHQDNGWQYDFQNEQKYKVCKDCGYEMGKWDIASCPVYFSPNGGSGSMPSIHILEGMEFTFPKNGFTAPDAKVFIGWTNNLVQIYRPGQTYKVEYALQFNAVWIPEAEHSHIYDSDYEFDTLKHWKECVCGAKDTSTVHDFGAWNTTKEPTTDEKGEKERYCNTCNYKETAEIDKLSGRQPENSSTGGASSDNSSSDSTQTPATKNPQTGDNANIFIWMMALIISGAVIYGVAVYSKKRISAK